jgi:hypothetical protein
MNKCSLDYEVLMPGDHFPPELARGEKVCSQHAYCQWMHRELDDDALSWLIVLGR